jgi:hypothetical protein
MIDLATIVPAGALLEPGVYFGLDEEIYHRSFGLSASGIKHLRVSPLDWWTRSPLNPNFDAVLAEEGDTEAMAIGRAYDVRIISGKAEFDRRYVSTIDKGDYPGALDTVDDLKSWLAEKGLKTSAKRKSELIDRVIEADPAAKIWDAIQDGYRKTHEGKEFLPPRLIEKIEIAARMIESHPVLSKAFTGGAPQVSVIWDCPIIGVRCKARFDRLKAKAIIDLKTLTNTQSIPLDAAIAREIGYRKYHLQAWWYLDAARQIADFIKAGRVFGDADKTFLQALAANHDKTWMWVFQIKGVAPVAKGRTLPPQSTLMRLAQGDCESAKQVFRTNLETFGADPWVDVEQILPIDDTAVPSWSLT